MGGERKEAGAGVGEVGEGREYAGGGACSLIGV